MTKLTRFKFLMWALGLIAFFVLLMTFLPVIVIRTIFNGVFIGIVIAVVIVYAPLLRNSKYFTKIDRVSQLTIGICLFWLSLAGQKVWWTIWHIAGMPVEWRSHPILACFEYLAIIGGCLFVTAPGYPPEDITENVEFGGSNRMLLIVSATICAIVVYTISFWVGNII